MCQSMLRLRTISQVVKESLTSERFNATLFGGFGAIGLLLAAFGLYGLLAFAVAQRTRGIGIRIALGATRRHVLARTVRHGMTPAVVGASVGLVGALAVRRVLGATITGTQPPLWLVLAAVVILLVTACIGCLLPESASRRPLGPIGGDARLTSSPKVALLFSGLTKCEVAAQGKCEMADQHAYRLRELCLGYPRSSVTQALSLAVGATVSDEGERQTLSLLLSELASDDRGIGGSPPIDDTFVESVWRILRAGAH